ncbi:hypothetical protein AgCh_036218 [Apium graveolens]
MRIWLRGWDRDEKREREKFEREANAIKKALELGRMEKRSNKLKVGGLSRVSKNGVFLNIKTHRFSRKVQRKRRRALRCVDDVKERRITSEEEEGNKREEALCIRPKIERQTSAIKEDRLTGHPHWVLSYICCRFGTGCLGSLHPESKPDPSEEISEDDYNNQQAEFIVKVSADTLGEMRIYFKDDLFNLLNMEGRRMWLRGWDRDEKREMEKFEREANAIKKALELGRMEKRSNKLKAG